jgi:hypothetical protein
MTEAEIMKALECCNTNNYDDCCECPLYYEADCAFPLAVNCLELINRKNAEIERATKEVDRLSQVVLYHDGQISDARAEAIKEVLQRARGKVCCIPRHHFTLEQVLCDIDVIAKEMGVSENV